MKTNRPIYGDREDGNKVHYDYEKVSLKERTSYGWRGEYGIGSAVSYYRRCKRIGPEAYLTEQQKKPSARVRTQRAKNAESGVRKAIAAMDEKGRWITKEVITCEAFVRNFRILCDYLELARPKKPQ